MGKPGKTEIVNNRIVLPGRLAAYKNSKTITDADLE